MAAMKKAFQLLLYPLLAVVAILVAHSALAQSAEPLVIIRFNQPRVYYEQQLYNAISKAVAIKPDLTIDVVSYSPEVTSSSASDDWQETASAHTRGVVNVLTQMGVPMSRIHVSGQRMSGINFDETHVFVQ